jgi:ribosomal protein S18 acetylase RimI-like enzyme
VDCTILRKEKPEDEPFLISLYASIRETELAGASWTQAQKSTFLKWQFALQRAQYRAPYPNADFCIIETEEHAIGRFYVHRGIEEIRLIDVTLLSAWQRRGIGSACVDALLAEAKAADLPVSLHVEPQNPARRLYLRAGFRCAAQLGVYERLVWLPAHQSHYRAQPTERGQQQDEGGRLWNPWSDRPGVDRERGKIETE